MGIINVIFLCIFGLKYFVYFLWVFIGDFNEIFYLLMLMNYIEIIF